MGRDKTTKVKNFAQDVLSMDIIASISLVILVAPMFFVFVLIPPAGPMASLVICTTFPEFWGSLFILKASFSSLLVFIVESESIKMT